MTTTTTTLVVFASLFFAACGFRPDVEAVDQHLREECGLAFFGPNCAGDDEARAEASRVSIEHFSAYIDTAERERCVLDVECEGRDDDDVIDDVKDCVDFDGNSSPGPLSDCIDDCEAQLAVCGDGSATCGERDAVETCFETRNRCIDGCFGEFGNLDTAE